METTVYLAALETPNFKLEAVGCTADSALELLEGAWLRHHMQSGQPAGMLSFDILLEGCDQQQLPGYACQVKELRVGRAWLDGSHLTG